LSERGENLTKEENQKKKRQKKNDHTKKFESAVCKIASIIDSLATGMQADIENGGGDIKQLKELTGAAKELSSLICALDEKEERNAPHEKSGITVHFTSKGEEWAK